MLYIPNCVQRNSIYSNVCWLNILSVGSHCWTQHGCQSFPCAVIEFKCSKPLKGWSNLNSQVWTTKLKSKRNKSHKYIYIVINSCNLYQRYIYIYVFLLISLESLYVGTNQFWIWSLNEIVQRNYKTNVVKFGCMRFSIKTETIWKESVKKCVAQYVCCQLLA